MLKYGADSAAIAASAKFHRVICDDVKYTYFDDAIPDGDVGDKVSPIKKFGSDNPLITELLELSGALQIAEAGWLCRIDDGKLAELIAQIGARSPHEIADVLHSLAGPVNFSQASAPFSWLSGGREYIVCAIGDGSAGQIVLFLRAKRLQVANWPRVQKAAARVQRLMSIGLSISGTVRASAPGRVGEAESSARALVDLFPFGIMVVDIDQTILLANAAMKAFFADTPLIGNLGGRLAVFNSDDAVRVHVALRAVLAAPAEDEAPHTIALTNDGGRPILLSVARMAGNTGASRACIMVTDSAADYRVHIQPLAHVFALTPVETRLVMQLAEGRSVQEAAQRLKLKVETARTYLKQIFQKTGTHRQIELIQLMKGGALPLLA